MIDKINQVYQMLEDEQSKDIYLARLNDLVTGAFRHLEAVIEKYNSDILVSYDKLISDFIHSLPKDNKILLYGTGAVGQSHLHYFENDKRFIGFCDRDIAKQKNGLKGYPVISPERLFQMEDVSVVITTTKAKQEIKETLKQANFPEGRIYSLPECYTVENRGEGYWNFMLPQREDPCADEVLGTSLELTRYGGKLKKKYLLEPNDINKDAELRRVEAVEILHQCRTCRKPKECHFRAAADGGAGVYEDAAGAEVMFIDEAVVGQGRIEFIKLDVGGAELEFLKGAKHTVLRNMPKLAICIHHKPEDIVEIPMYIKELVPEYKLYVRCQSDGFGKTFLYAIKP